MKTELPGALLPASHHRRWGCLIPAALFALVLPSYGLDESARVQTLDALAPMRHNENASRVNFSVGHPDLGEIGLVNRQEVPKMITLQTNQLFSYTSNAFLSRDDAQGSALWNGRLATTVVPYSTRNFTPSISFEQNFFRYERFSRLDFDTQTLSLNAKYDLTRDDRWTTNSSVSLTRLYTSRFDAGDLYRYGVISESLTYVRQLSKWPIYTGSSLGGAFRLGDPSVFDRWSIFLNSAAIYAPASTLQLAAFVRPEVFLFTNQDGAQAYYGSFEYASVKHPTDFDLSAGASVTWSPCKEFSVGVNFLYTQSWSTYGPHEYAVASPSLSFSASYAF